MAEPASVESSESTKERIIQAAIRALDKGGEGSLRIIEVAKEAQVSQGMIRYYFGDRESLIVQALAVRFRSRYGYMLDVFTDKAALCVTSEDFRALITEVLNVIYVEERSRFRLERNNEIGNAKDHEFLAEQIAESRDHLCRHIASVFELLQARGLFSSNVDPLEMAAFYMTFSHGISLWEFGPEFVTRKQMVDTFLEALFLMIFD